MSELVCFQMAEKKIKNQIQSALFSSRILQANAFASKITLYKKIYNHINIHHIGALTPSVSLSDVNQCKCLYKMKADMKTC